MKPVVVVYKPLYEEALQYIQSLCQVEYFPGYERTDPAFVEALGRADGLIGSGLKVDEALLDKAPNLKVIANKSVGYDNLDIGLLKKRGIQAANTPGVLDDTVADTIMALVLAAARRVTELDRFVKTGDWAEKGFHEDQFGVDVHHKTLGIIGMGGIGRTVAKRAHFGFDMNILYHNRSRQEEEEHTYDAVYCTMDELLEQSDFVCVMTPLTEQTRGMIGREAFEKMKETAVFINASRGPVVDEKALIHALQSKQIRAAGLDVFEQEPVRSDNPLLQMDNVVTLPHIGSATEETRKKMAMLAAENVVAGVIGQTLKTPIY
ncbi:D-glycerate dehydrogenase [Domibacillus sp. DTU_2020_1001157_1_SI_ALB_TIR_016]|uniref:2-hydroxyacid dehydrogenase n=1 Tax=Domibacillus sp. DTU_2020_1001157_1_SI_ALB_TIR_016 TaxID=3077789 RepID=UPI0028F04CBC|nr:D-glycerate dehydrogenase [Domibacillus sp. DTU_2020_1001157_1_SI_ALB_TIR_016]WNS80938.1 D-glycerate dehydrogenase [Domibacillus sp. DTU_2020_1001157_1_SI_ALB_TIR_016]